MEGEFGIYRQSAGGCYYISVEQIVKSLVLQRLKLFSELGIEEVVSHSKEKCCTASLTEGDIFVFEEAFLLTLSNKEESSLFYISRYAAFKGSSNLFKNSEFLLSLSRGKLSYSPAELFEVCCILFCYYKTCINHLLIDFDEIYESCQLEYDSYKSILRRFSSCFSKAFSNGKSNKLTEKKKNDVTRRRVSYK